MDILRPCYMDYHANGKLITLSCEKLDQLIYCNEILFNIPTEPDLMLNSALHECVYLKINDTVEFILKYDIEADTEEAKREVLESFFHSEEFKCYFAMRYAKDNAMERTKGAYEHFIANKPWVVPAFEDYSLTLEQ